ncbi:4-carboxymuconolactone decarboxylase [Natronocella acetinitrilica]|uniref:4-carboxymuconolactone decarboxylase n=1 Tax=Natronocella acetinitrilica TaxID=414046 RepID=A0AAE3KIB8_9GAMM|nr:carboxymuconolactone decarboxylase family protein [Natronocella acetinitrilica]MCP1677242.1 4-carboxymuconolactone decarboxylase [Natronocella acetinitrilica]
MADDGYLYQQAQIKATELFGTPEGDLTGLPIDPADQFSKELLTWVFGYLFTERSLIPTKSKVLALIAMCAASGRSDMLRRWLTAAKNSGCSRDEVQETILTMVMYGGWPVARDSLEVLSEHWPASAK